MAGIFDNVSGPADPAREQKWMDYFSKPEGRSALLQFGVNMLQPMQHGQSFLGHLGQSVGSGAQAATRTGAAELAKQQRAAAAQQQQFDNRISSQKADALTTTANARTISANRPISALFTADRRSEDAKSRAVLDRLSALEENYIAFNTGDLTPDVQAQLRAQAEADVNAAWGSGGSSPAAPATTGNFSQDELMQQAREAISQGADPQEVHQMLLDFGVDPGLIGQ